jgi:hypothetical protein
MAWTTPPTFVTSNAASAAQLNILSDDLEFLQGVAAGPNAPFQSVVFTTSGTATYHLRYRYPYLHYSYTVSVDPGDDVKIKVNGTTKVSDGAPGEATVTSYVDLTSMSLTTGTWYPVTFEWAKDANSVCTVHYLVTSNATSL